jgi:hypothetical protein
MRGGDQFGLFVDDEDEGRDEACFRWAAKTKQNKNNNEHVRKV